MNPTSQKGSKTKKYNLNPVSKDFGLEETQVIKWWEKSFLDNNH